MLPAILEHDAESADLGKPAPGSHRAISFLDVFADTASDPGREEHLTRAIDIFTQLGAAWDLERATEELTKVS